MDSARHAYIMRLAYSLNHGLPCETHPEEDIKEALLVLGWTWEMWISLFTKSAGA